MSVILNNENLLTAAHWLAEQDAELALVLEKHGPPPLWARPTGFATVVHIILEQQVSLASANAAFNRLQQQVDALTPDQFMQLDDVLLREIGFSRQKILYTRSLAEAVLAGDFSFEQLATMDDEAVKVEMKRLKGIGDWTAEVYLSECLMRPDVLPKGDIAMLEAIKVLKKLDKRPQHDHFLEITAHWRPWRSVGSRMLWHYYLSERGRKNTIGG